MTRSWLPLVLTPALLVAVLALGTDVVAHAAGAGQLLSAVLVALYVTWMLGEGGWVSVADARRTDAPRDAGTLEVYALARGAVAVTALALPGRLTPALLAPGAALLVLGVALRLEAIRTLGAFYSHRVRLEAGQAVVVRSVYAHLRHPAYAGMLLAHAGWCLALASVPGALVLALGLLPAIVRRIAVEERTLLELDGYADYARRTARLVPGVW
ncbi:MAG TPA: isoprenylcysteine carboxylmethyltransferase family protein [Planctomycetota bacterium]|nr:isoprenylcysteine carboxylmethyltransferase family protein [Planctomycetota bacterium]